MEYPNRPVVINPHEARYAEVAPDIAKKIGELATTIKRGRPGAPLSPIDNYHTRSSYDVLGKAGTVIASLNITEDPRKGRENDVSGSLTIVPKNYGYQIRLGFGRGFMPTFLDGFTSAGVGKLPTIHAIKTILDDALETVSAIVPQEDKQ